jgi:8-oxo-dGTP diphosphatase
MGKSDQGLTAGRDRFRAIPRVLVFLRNSQEILLLKGATDKRIWPNLYNGVGGHVEAYEDVLSAARREVREETGLTVADLELKAVVNIDAGESGLGIVMFVFVGWSQERETISSPEGELQWIPMERVGSYPLVEDLVWLLPRILTLPRNGPPMFLHYGYNDEDELVIRQA